MLGQKHMTREQEPPDNTTVRPRAEPVPPTAGHTQAGPVFFVIQPDGVTFLDIEPIYEPDIPNPNPIDELMKQVREEDSMFEQTSVERALRAGEMQYAEEAWRMLHWLQTLARFTVAVSSSLAESSEPEAREALYGALFELDVERLRTHQQLAADSRAPAWLQRRRYDTMPPPSTQSPS